MAAYRVSGAAVAPARRSPDVGRVAARGPGAVGVTSSRVSLMARAMLGAAADRLRPTGSRPGAAAHASDPPTIDVLLPAAAAPADVEAAVQAVRSADYPPDRLELHVIREADDATSDELRSHQTDDLTALRIPADYPGEPSKLRALNYGYSRTDAELVGVIDPGDAVDPGLFREAAAVFDDGDCDFALARVDVAEEDNGWFNLLFRPENGFLYELVVPTFARAGYPVPLGGTPCFFRRSVLEEAAEERFKRYGSPWTISERLWLVEQGYLDPVPWDPTNGAGDFELGLFLWEEGYSFEYLGRAAPGDPAVDPAPAGARGATPSAPFLARLWRTVRGRDGASNPPGSGAEPAAVAAANGPTPTGRSGKDPEPEPRVEPADDAGGRPVITHAEEAVRAGLEAGVASARQLDRALPAGPRETTPPSADIAAAFIREVEAGSMPDEVRDGLAGQLRELLEPPPAGIPPARIRLGTIEARLGAVERAASTSGTILDRHGSGEAFLTEARTDLGWAETAVEAARDDLDDLTASQAAAEAALAALADDVDRLGRRLELVDARLDALAATRRAAVSAVRGDAEAVAGQLGRREQLGEEVDALQDAVADVEARHGALLEALEADGHDGRGS